MNRAAKGKAFEQRVTRTFRDAGYDAKRTRLSGHGQEKPSDGRVIIGQRYYTFECKKKKAGWAQLYEWTGADQFAVIAADRREPLVVLRLETLLEMLGNGEKGVR